MVTTLVTRQEPPLFRQREPDPFPKDARPMLAVEASELPEDAARYGFEFKWDGVRALAYADGGRLHLKSRNGLELANQFPELAPLAAEIPFRKALLDGEIVALDEQGRPDFGRLQQRLNVQDRRDVAARARAFPVTIMLFDVLYYEGRNVMRETYEQRRVWLDSMQLHADHWSTPAYWKGHGRAVLDASRARGLEGVMAKRLDSRYVPGKRSPGWIKIKNGLRQEFVVGGYTQGEGTRARLGALVVGYYDEDRLVYAGRVGSGMAEADLGNLPQRLATLQTPTNPFSVTPHERGVRYVEPRIVVEVEFEGWTKNGILRLASFQGIRNDKDARDVHRHALFKAGRA